MRGGRMKRADKRETYLTFGKERESGDTRGSVKPLKAHRRNKTTASNDAGAERRGRNPQHRNKANATKGAEAGRRTQTRNRKQPERARRTKSPERGSDRSNGAPEGRSKTTGPDAREQLYHHGARLSRKEQSREAPLGDDRDLTRGAGQHCGTDGLVCWRVLTQKR